MKLNTLTSLLFAPVVFASQLWGQEYNIKLLSNNDEVAVIELSISGDVAIARVNDVTERFDLKQQRWQQNDSKKWVTLLECENWAKQSKEKSRSSKASIPENIRPFVTWSLDPVFEKAATETTLSMKSGQVDYKIVGEKSDSETGLTNYCRYARLNAYKKAMTERQLPPFAELQVIDEMERRKLMPKTMEIEIPGVAGAPLIRMVITGKL